MEHETLTFILSPPVTFISFFGIVLVSRSTKHDADPSSSLFSLTIFLPLSALPSGFCRSFISFQTADLKSSFVFNISIYENCVLFLSSIFIHIETRKFSNHQPKQ